ncbi:MAG: 3-keto-5-aminohexanoate cleavage protein [Desulfomonile tiedjei]|uniref:3-keto-5-aminohexanoate cleavage protein n=1 Tax=Desulfomonile tiedjei TaxID=2358 RepID=A0A9D6Z0B3_9BACT|nr:3-keto-5-aminohexanoate cleavage protein [Desulfomonile tiedjei]
MSSMWIKDNRNFERPCMITCALSGVVANREQCPAIPYTPEEYAAEAKRAYEAGASVAHIHARTREGLPSYEVEDYKNIYDAVTDVCPIIINFSTGAINVTTQQKIAHIQAIKPPIGALNMGSMNYAKYNPGKKRFVFEFVFPNPFSEIMQIVQAMNGVQTKPELECFDIGHVGNSFPLIDMGLLQPPFQYSLIMGVLGGIPPTVSNLIAMVDLLKPDSDWEVIGISLDQWRMVAAAIALGGNIRVGLEDNFYLQAGVMAKSNGDLVDKAARMVRDQGREVATVEECRQRLNLVNR